MTAHDLIQQLRDYGFKVRANGQHVTVAPASELSPEFIAQIKQHKPEILVELAAEARRQKAISMLDTDPALIRAVTVDDIGYPDELIMTIALRGIGVVDMLLPRSYDRFALLALIEQHGQMTH